MAFIVPRGSKVCVPPLLLSVLPVLRHVVYSNTFSKKVVCEANRFPFTSGDISRTAWLLLHG